MSRKTKGGRPDLGEDGKRSRFTLLPFRPSQALGGIPSTGCRAASRGGAGNLKKSSHSQRGVTLIESALVISIIALIILATLLALNTFMSQKRITQAVTDVTVIRSAVSKWTGGGFVTYTSGQNCTGQGENRVCTPNVDTVRSLRRFDQIGGFLTEPLRTLAREEGDSNTGVLTEANPWGGSYTIAGDVTDSRKWTLTITNVPETFGPAFANQLKAVGALDAMELSGSETTNADGDLVVQVRVTFRE